MLEPVERPATLSDLAYERIRHGILSEGLLTKKRTSVVALAGVLGMSRSPVRSAIERLASEGLVTLQPDGVSLVDHTHANLLELLQVRAVLEGLSVRLATPRLDAAAFAKLEGIQAEFDQSISAGKVNTAREADLNFHQTIMDYANNHVLREELAHLQARVIVGTYTIAWTPDQRMALGEHNSILQAMKTGNAEDAEKCATDHMQQLMNRIKDSATN